MGERKVSGSVKVTDRDRLLDQLRGAGAKEDAEIDLAETALVLAALDRPENRIDDYRPHLAVLAEDTARSAQDVVGLNDKVAAIRDVIFGLHGYAGDIETYEDMQNANLMSVIDRRKGLPVALGILCVHVARSQGWDIEGVNFPAHFLIRIRTSGESAVVDPFDAAQVLDEPALRSRLKELHGADVELSPSNYRPVGNRDILLRLQNNIKIRALRDKDTNRALNVIESMVCVAPKQGDLRLEMAVLQAQTGKLKSSIRVLEEFLDLPGEAERHDEAAELLQGLKGKLN